MPFFGRRLLKQRASYWQCVGRDSNGQPVLSANPVTLKVRWDGQERVVFDSMGTPIGIGVEVIVPIDIPIGSAMCEGALEDLPGSIEVPNQNVYEVVAVKRTPDARGRDTVRKVTLIRKRDTL